MICSMTAYVSRKIKSVWGITTWEIRSVNQRYLEVSFRCPEQFRVFEPILRERLYAKLARGKIECNFYFESNISSQTKLIINKKLAKQLINLANWVKTQGGKGNLNPLEVLHWPNVVVTREKNVDVVATDVLNGFDNVMREFIIIRETEGQKLKRLIEQRLKKVSDELVKIRTCTPKIISWQRQRLLKTLEDVRTRLEGDHRLEQELALIAHRIDITEELDRLEAHIEEVYKILRKNEAVGRRLDFMMQELNRESNTIASKSIDIGITNSSIELKVLIEQMREQIQNIE